MAHEFVVGIQCEQLKQEGEIPEEVIDCCQSYVFPPKKSQYITQYFSKIIFQGIDIQQSITNFLKHKIKYAPYQRYKDFSFSIKAQYSNFQTLIVNASLAYFQLQLTLFNLKEDNPYTLINDSGTYASIYHVNFNQQTFTIKSILYPNTQIFPKYLSISIKQYCIWKICSTLECSAKACSPLGFDLIIYNDCIQFSMQKCIKKQVFTNEDINSLFENLSKMHIYGIIHCDIKPQNILWSPSYKKMVFIDFGLSDIIQQKCGELSLTKYKGTPSFSSRQMVQLFNNEDCSFVDLYYNDLFGLERVINLLSKVKNFNTCRQFQFGEYQVNPSQIIYRSEITQSNQHHCLENNLISIQFSYYYLNEHENRIKRLLQSFRFLKINYLPLVFRIIKKYLKIRFVQSIFYEYLNPYRNMSEYQQIQKQIISQKGQLSLKDFISSNNNQQNSFVYRYCFNMFEKDANLSIFICDFAKIKQFIEFNSFNDKQKCFSVLLQCLRFDCINLSIYQKYQTAELACGHVVKNIQTFQNLKQQSSASFFKIQKVFSAMIQFCLSQPFSKWKSQNIFDVLFQMIMLHVNVTEQIHRLFKITQQHYSKPAEYQLLAMQFLRFTSFLTYLKLTPTIIEIYYTAQNYCRNYQNKFDESVINTNDRQCVAIANIKGELNKEGQHSIYQFNVEFCLSQLKYIKNKQLFKLLETSIIIFSLKELERNSSISVYFMTIKETINKLKSTNKLNFRFKLFLYQIILHRFRNSPQFQFFAKYMKEIINCSQIFKNLRINLRAIPFKLNVSLQQIDSALGYYQQFYEFEKEINSNILSDIQLLVDKLQTDITPGLKSKLLSLYTKMANFSLYQRQDIKYLKQYQKIFQQSFLMANFSYFGIEFETIFIQYLKSLKLKLEPYKYIYLNNIKDQQYIQKSFQILPFKFEYLVSIMHYHMINGRYVQAYPFCKSLQMEISVFNHNKFTIHIIANMIRIAQEMGRPEEVEEYLRKIYNICISSSNISFYFQPHTKVYLIEIFLVFIAKRQYQNVYGLLSRILDWVDQFSFEGYLKIFIEIIAIFWNNCKEIFDLQCLSKKIDKGLIYKSAYFIVYLLKSTQLIAQWPQKFIVLRKISKSISHINKFVKPSILQEYFQIHLNYNELKTRQRKDILKKSKYFESNHLFNIFVKKSLRKLKKSIWINHRKLQVFTFCLKRYYSFI